MSHQAILSMLGSKVGFRFNESELSPTLRKRLGDLESLKGVLDRSGNEIGGLEHRKATTWGYAFFSGLVGLVLLILGFVSLLFIVLGVIALGIAVSFYRSRARPLNLMLSQKRRDLAVIALAFEYQLSKVSEEVFQQLAEIHEAKIRPTVRHVVIDFAAIIQAAHGRGIILDTMQCPSCSGTVSIPKDGDVFQCKYCGKAIHAVDIFEKLKLA